MLYLIGFTLTLGLSAMSYGFAMCQTGPIIPALKYQLNWGDESSTIDFNTTILTTSAVFGLALGSIFGADFIKNGRRQALIKFNIIGMFGSAIALYLNFWGMCFGRMIFGFSAGVIICATPKMVEETIPSNVIEKGFGTSTNILINSATFTCLMLPSWLPENKEELQHTKFWMIQFGI